MDIHIQSNRNIRGAFWLVFFWVMVFLFAYSWYSWDTTKKAETERLAMLAELESKSLDSLFSHFESILNLLAQDLKSKNMSMSGLTAHALLERLKYATHELENINIVQPDGQVVASAIDPPGLKLPFIAKEASFILGREVLANGPDFDIGRPFFGRIVGEWIIPLRYAIRDQHGKLIYIIQATLPLARQLSFWQSLYLPKNMLLGLLRDDGYLLSRYPSEMKDMLDEFYAKPRTGVLISHLKQARFPLKGVVEGITGAGINNVIAYHRLSWSPLTLFVSIPMANIRAAWWKNNQAFYLLTGVSLLGAIFIYVWLIRRQAEWEIERDAANQQVIGANNARSQAERERLALELDVVKLALDEHSIVSRTDVAGNIIYVNDRFCNISGYSQDELIGQNHRILNSGLHTAEFFKELWLTISCGNIWHGEIRNKKKDGSYYWVDSTIVPFLDKDGKPYQYVSIRTNITPYIEARGIAEAANRTKSTFLSSMSHELRTPLNAILGFAQLLAVQIEADNREQQESVSHIISAGEQLLGLINDLLDLSRIEVGKLDFNIQDVSIAELVSSSVSIVASSLGNKRYIQIINGLIDTKVLVRGDSLRIRQILINLLNNAVKYNRENGSVKIDSIEQKNGMLRIQVIDTGAGIASEQLPLLFKHFERINQKHGAIEGSGIGLYVSKQLVEAMLGNIGVESVQGQGSIFWFELPLALKQEGLA